MDEIYDVYLVTLPDSLKETLEKAQQVKEEMYKKYIKRIVEIKESSEAEMTFNDITKVAEPEKEDTKTIKVNSIAEPQRMSEQVKIRGVARVSVNLDIESRLSERRFSNLNF